MNKKFNIHSDNCIYNNSNNSCVDDYTHDDLNDNYDYNDIGIHFDSNYQSDLRNKRFDLFILFYFFFLL